MRRNIVILWFCLILFLWVGCEKQQSRINLPQPPPDWRMAITQYPQIETNFGMPTDQYGGRILDFSRVGYHWGDAPIPEVKVVKTIEAPTDGSDARDLIASAIKEVSKLPFEGNTPRGAILLKAGTYYVSTQINLSVSGVVLRGEGEDKTIIIGTGERQVNVDSPTENLITVGGSGSRIGTKSAAPNVLDTYIPEGRFWLRVSNPSSFRVFDDVVIYRAVNDKWIKDLGMTGIWTTSSVNQQYAERVITKINNDTLWFENPIPCSIETQYGGAYVYKYSYSNRVSECGIENMSLQSEFFSPDNEQHCWNGVGFTLAEHCWMRNVSGKHFGFGLATVRPNAKNITVQDCVCTHFQSTLDGSRRYPFLCCGQLSLFLNCNSEDARHPYATSGSSSVGPNVFSGGEALRSTADTGPHRCWAAGTLYENLKVEGQFNIRNRYTNSSHGWAGTNDVAWNCSSSSFPDMSWSYGFIVQSPQVSGRNYCIGCKGTIKTNTFDLDCSPPSAEGVFISHGEHVMPRSLYEAQLTLRNKEQPLGVFDVK